MLEVKGRSNLRTSVSVVAMEDSWFCVTARAALKLTTCLAWIALRDHSVSHIELSKYISKVGIELLTSKLNYYAFINEILLYSEIWVL